LGVKYVFILYEIVCSLWTWYERVVSWKFVNMKDASRKTGQNQPCVRVFSNPMSMNTETSGLVIPEVYLLPSSSKASGAKVVALTSLVALLLVGLVASNGDMFGLPGAVIPTSSLHIPNLRAAWGRTRGTSSQDVHRLGHNLRALKKDEAGNEGVNFQDKIKEAESAAADKMGELRASLDRNVNVLKEKLTDASATAESEVRDKAAQLKKDAAREAEKLQDKIKEAESAAGNKVGELRSSVDRNVNALKEKLTDASSTAESEVRDKAAQLKKDAAREAEKLQDKIQQAKSTGANKVDEVRASLDRSANSVKDKLTDMTAKTEESIRNAAESGADAVREKAAEARRLADQAAEAVKGVADDAKAAMP